MLEHRGISSAVSTTDPFQQGHSTIVFSDKVHPFPDPLCKSLASRPHGRDPQLNVSVVVQKRTIVSTLHHETGAESPEERGKIRTPAEQLQNHNPRLDCHCEMLL